MIAGFPSRDYLLFETRSDQRLLTLHFVHHVVDQSSRYSVLQILDLCHLLHCSTVSPVAFPRSFHKNLESKYKRVLRKIFSF